jgi:hypothetical protein
LLTLAALAGTVPLPAPAGQDPGQRALADRIRESERRQVAAEQAREQERRHIIAEHMRMMEENLRAMQEMRARPGMSMREHEEWIAEHQKLMDALLAQMIKDQQMLMALEK